MHDFNLQMKSLTKVTSNVGGLVYPCDIKTIKADGNFFFHSISFAMCQNEGKHLKIRQAIV